ncbi:MAG: putative hydro-lyase [Minwuia sp.]|nr:putative hydro-lyase [Minwuia sp.]
MPDATSFEILKTRDIVDVRAVIRAGGYQGHTAGLAPGRLQTNLAILPQSMAADFEQFCRLNPRPCPLVGMTEPGSPMMPGLGDIDLRTDVPTYNIYRDGVLAETVADITEYWRDDLVGFALGCSFTFEQALLEAGIPMHHIAADRTVPMYRTNIETMPVGPFSGGIVVSMRYVAPDQVARVTEITSAFTWAHGAPIHVGDPAAIGISNIEAPDWGDPPCGPADVPVFWACGVTPQNALTNARPPICITHTPGRMLIADIDDRKNATIN